MQQPRPKIGVFLEFLTAETSLPLSLEKGVAQLSFSIFVDYSWWRMLYGFGDQTQILLVSDPAGNLGEAQENRARVGLEVGTCLRK